jgi:hypothetical protein
MPGFRIYIYNNKKKRENIWFGAHIITTGKLGTHAK